MEIVITCLICCTVFLSILRITEKGIPIHITHEFIGTEQPELATVPGATNNINLDGVLAEINDAFGINVETEEDRDDG